MGNKLTKIYLLLLLISLIIYTVFRGKALFLLVIINIIIASIYIVKNIKKDVLTISVLFLINYLVYVLYIPFRLMDGEYYVDVYPLTMNIEVAARIVLICGIVSTVAFIIGHELMAAKRIKENKKNNTKYYIKSTRIFNKITFSYFFIFAGVALFLLGIIKQGGLRYLFNAYVWNSSKITEIGMMTTGIQIAFSGIIMSFYITLSKKDFKLIDLLKWPAGYIFIILVFIKFIQGGRIQVLMALVSLVGIFHYKYKKIKLKEACIFAMLGVVALGYIGYFRDHKQLIPKEFSTMFKYMFGFSGAQEYFLNSYTNFTTMDIIMNNPVSFIWGAGLIDGLVFLVPRAILPNKESLLVLNNKVLELSEIQNISPAGGLNLAAQNLINGDWIFTALFMLALGAFLYWIYNMRIKHSKLLLCMILPFIVISLARNPIYYTIKEVVQFALVPWLIFTLLSRGETYEKNSI